LETRGSREILTAPPTSCPSFPVLPCGPSTKLSSHKHSQALSNMSFESDRHLLAESVVRSPHSPTASLISVATATNPDGDQISPSQSGADWSDTASTIAPTETTYRGFPSEADYLAALRAWVEEKQYVQFDTALVGFYGTNPQADCLSKPGLGLRKKSKAQKEGKRRATVSGATGSGDVAAPAPKSQQSAFRWPRRSTLSRLMPSTSKTKN
jgi:hypothetical protein